MGLEYSVHPPNEFIRTHTDRLLPSWLVPVLSVLVVLQQSQVALIEKTPETEAHKSQLRQQFMELSHRIAQKLGQMGHLVEIFDPGTGLPLLSAPGSLKLDHVAVVQTALGYHLIPSGGCWLVEHPNWGSAVYPAILMSSAEIAILSAVVQSIAADVAR